MDCLCGHPKKRHDVDAICLDCQCSEFIEDYGWFSEEDEDEEEDEDDD